MMKKFYLLLFLFFIAASVQSKVIDYAKDGFPPLQPMNTVADNNYNNLNFNKVTQAERTILGQTYENQHIGVRLNRLERSVFNRTYPQMSYEQRMNNIIINYKNTVQRNASFNNLSKLEKKIFNRTYDNDLQENRIARLEEQVMGTIQSGDLNSRYNMLQKAVPRYGNRTYTTQTFSPYCGIPIARSGGGWRGLAGSLGNFFSGAYSGYPTGWTPPISTSALTSPYINNYGPDFQRGFYSNRGWGYHNTNYGSGSAVHILD